MSISADVPGLASLLLSLGSICLAVAFVGCIFTLVEAAFVVGFSDKEPARTDAEPAVTVLKPLHGAEPDLAGRLAAVCRQHYGGPVQVVCGAQGDLAPATAAVGEVNSKFPDSIELVADQRSHGANGKVSNLINMLPRARYDTIVLSDSDIVVERDYLRRIVALLGEPDVGAVTCLYHGIGGTGLWSRISALATNSHFLPQAITALGLKLGKPCCGATIALRRSMLDRIGGFHAFADVLADDYAIGVAVRAAGYDVKAAPFLVGHRCFEGSLREFMRHQIRVARTIRSIDPIGYAGTILTHPLPLALLGMLSGGITATLLTVAVLASRVTLCRCVERRFGLPRQSYWLIPLQDVLVFGVYVASFFGATVNWQGVDFRVAGDGTLIEEQDLRGS
ncbi:MAG TPA: bacteriohopanetetrol glucosamine biosynthesis glycosyltransferase HpnI [Xanthobacteraceae bacterium]|jgi:ceramide glucosyltransferase|nr:bacteriohopanetetrol glucosamine biosynthesis glycosyltransferase HpnI [Xanthobacteraceae bacterium]